MLDEELQVSRWSNYLQLELKPGLSPYFTSECSVEDLPDAAPWGGILTTLKGRHVESCTLPKVVGSLALHKEEIP